MHHPIQINQLELSFSSKICFENFNATINYGQVIGIIGNNGSGKSSLLNMLAGKSSSQLDQILFPKNIKCSYVPQIISEYNNLSGGELFNKALTEALIEQPDILLLDEPTNHLDITNRKSLFKMLKKFDATLIIASHDPELLTQIVNVIWSIENGKIEVFAGNYQNFLAEKNIRYEQIQSQIANLASEQKYNHQKLMKEQTRAKNSRLKGEKSLDQKKWPSIVSKAKQRRAQEFSGKMKKDLNQERNQLNAAMQNLQVKSIIKPKFNLPVGQKSNKNLIRIYEGAIGYDKPIINEINLTLRSDEKIGIIAPNGSGKSSLIKAILNDIDINKFGEWFHPEVKDIGYLDQHYNNLNSEDTIFETVQNLLPGSSSNEIRRYLNDYLFHSNQEVSKKIGILSQGEKVRISLAKIALQNFKLLILDEITNNIDLEMRRHIIQVLKDYPAAMIIISHEYNFLNEIGVETIYTIENKVFTKFEPIEF